MATEEQCEPKLLNLCIFNVTYGQKEGNEHEKILYFHPNNTPIDTQVRLIGLAEAITRFSSTFSDKADCESLQTQKTRQVFYQPEPNVWMVITVSVGWVVHRRDNGLVREYQHESVQDAVLRAYLTSAYRGLALIYSSIQEMTLQSADDYRHELSSYFDDFIKTLDLSTGDILTVWSGVSFLPLDRQSFLRVHCCVSQLQSSFPFISNVVFFYNRHVVWCGIEMEDLRSLTHYLVRQTLPDCVKDSRRNSISNSQYKTRFLNCGSSKLPQNIYLRQEKKLRRFRLMIYSLLGVVICLTVPVNEVLPGNALEKMDRMLEDRVPQLAADMVEQSSKKMTGNCRGETSGSSLPFVYHNETNLATKSTVHSESSGSLSVSLPAEIMRTLVDVNADMRSFSSGEMVVKAIDDYWIIGRRGEQREFCVVLHQKNANLVDVTDEVANMCSTQFGDIFMAE